MSESKSRRSKSTWTCPGCGREFARANQSHSCRVKSIDDHFRDRDPELRALFDALARALRRSGLLRTDSVQSTINLASDHHFGGVAVRRDSLRVGFVVARQIRHPRIARVQRIGPTRVLHHVVVARREDLDAELLEWLAEAQALQTR